MRRFPIELLIVVVVVVMLIWAGGSTASARWGASGRRSTRRRAPSELYARMLVRYAKPPIYQEEYRMSDIEGVSAFSYRIRGYNGRQITIKAPPARGLRRQLLRRAPRSRWRLADRQPRPVTRCRRALYRLREASRRLQTGRSHRDLHRSALLGDEGADGSTRSISRKACPTICVHMTSTQVADPRYEQIVKDFRDFGPDEFRHNVAAAQATHSRLARLIA